VNAALALRSGVLYAARGGAALRVRLFDWDGAELGPGFTWRPERGGRVAANALAVDADRRLWLADGPARRVRLFHVFGAATHELLDAGSPLADRAGGFGRPSALAAEGSADDLELLVGSAGERRHGAQLFGPDGALLRSLQPAGEPHGRFRGVAAVALAGRLAFVGEARRPWVHVYRDREHHFGFEPVDGRGRVVPLVALAPLGDGSLVVLGRGPEALLVFDAAGRHTGTLACLGNAQGELDEPVGLAVECTGEARSTRVAVLDRAGDRLQVFNLEGTCYGAVTALG
jgi:hypothetical protein